MQKLKLFLETQQNYQKTAPKTQKYETFSCLASLYGVKKAWTVKKHASLNKILSFWEFYKNVNFIKFCISEFFYVGLEFLKNLALSFSNILLKFCQKSLKLRMRNNWNDCWNWFININAYKCSIDTWPVLPHRQNLSNSDIKIKYFRKERNYLKNKKVV